jgi:lipopolysaccharide transport system ATP-binding protein
MRPIIKVSGLSKKYRIQTQASSYDTLRDALTRMARSPFRNLRERWTGNGETIWAVKDVSFEVLPGEVVGIIGRNGAGKSTLLKILSRITEPTSGKVELYGRVGSLLEVGTGFHPELTGRENIYLNGAVLGMRKAEIDRKFDQIVAFAELERFLDTPVKRYSSGMYMRLAFAVASHLEPEILIVDEVLAVGDAAFQKKCLGKMEDVAHEGRTVLFVSHNMAAIRTLCGRTLWLDEGQIMRIGPTAQVVADYVQEGAASTLERVWEDPATAPGNEKVKIRSARVRTVPEGQEQSISIHTPFQLEFEFWNQITEPVLNFTMHLYTIEGTYVFATCSQVGARQQGLIKEVVKIPGEFLNAGIYSVTIQIVEDARSLDLHPGILSFEVHDPGSLNGFWSNWPGIVRPKLEWISNQLINGRSS